MLGEQNSELNIQRLAAQRHLYRKAKVLQHWRFALTVPVILALAGATTLLKSTAVASWMGSQPYDAEWILAVASVVIFALDRLILAPLQTRKKALAASIQEEFDCEVLSIAWNSTALPRHPSREAIIEHGTSYLSKHGASGLLNWYVCPCGNNAPDVATTVICQRSNIAWDSRLRQRYVWAMVVLGACAGAALFGLAAAGDLAFRMLLVSVVVPLLPVAGFVIQEIHQTQDAIKELDEIEVASSQVWDKVLSANHDTEELARMLRSIQDRIHSSRKRSQMIPDWFYDRFKPAQESIMSESAEQMCNEYHARSQDASETVHCDA